MSYAGNFAKDINSLNGSRLFTSLEQRNERLDEINDAL